MKSVESEREKKLNVITSGGYEKIEDDFGNLLERKMKRKKEKKKINVITFEGHERIIEL